MSKLVNDMGFEKIEILTSLNARCSLGELLFIEGMVKDGKIKKLVKGESKLEKENELPDESKLLEALGSREFETETI